MNIKQLLENTITTEILKQQIDFISEKIKELKKTIEDNYQNENWLLEERQMHKEYYNFMLITRMKLSLIKIKKEIQEQKQKVKEYNN